jgi:hypothetical protein
MSRSDAAMSFDENKPMHSSNAASAYSVTNPDEPASGQVSFTVEKPTYPYSFLGICVCRDSFRRQTKQEANPPATAP